MAEAALYEAPFEYVREHVDQFDALARRARCRDGGGFTRRPVRACERRFAGLDSVHRDAARLTKHRLFVWLDPEILPDTSRGRCARRRLHVRRAPSRVHELWARGTGTQLREVESGFRYTPTTTFETFPFPQPDRRATRESRGGRPPPRRTARRLAQPARPRSRRPREADPHQPLQPAPRLARPRPRRPRRCRVRRHMGGQPNRRCRDVSSDCCSSTSTAPWLERGA